jgi:DNA-binding beta-propeller fold protein YncE
MPIWVCCGVVAMSGGLAAAAAADPLYAITKVVPIGAPDRWDLLTVDSESHRVYIAHGGRLTVVDGVDGTAGLAGSFDLNTLKPLKFVNAESDADALIYDPASRHVFVVDSDPGKIFVNGEERQEILVVDTRTNQIAARSDGAAFDPGSRRAFSSNGDGTLTVIGEQKPNAFVVLGTVTTRLSARTMTVDSTTGRLYLVAADMKINKAAHSNDLRHRYTVVPGTAVVLFLDPLKA